jgi:hypothetical protein
MPSACTPRRRYGTHRAGQPQSLAADYADLYNLLFYMDK